MQLEDAGNGQKINIEKRAFPDVVVWNPWSTKAKEMADFGDEEYRVLSRVFPSERTSLISLNQRKCAQALPLIMLLLVSKSVLAGICQTSRCKLEMHCKLI